VDPTPDGVFNPAVDKVYFSLKRGSPMIGSVPAGGGGASITEGDILTITTGGLLRIQKTAALLGLFINPYNQLDALDRITVAPALACYANCDESTLAPALNVLDFACFLNKFAAGDAYANCDGSTTSPLLNVLDFACFLNAFAAGCS